ncbi:hypothetical protein PENTCL1PPCAC_6079 [Pristionchus entomophagus]|uniref:Uncharacterized protein n=1 Tax=Pristionchus entomophagus TaxID=358040 RepID=A0AAV5SUM0_9BILA|nr:hypothetical protein PENTCL1PPCAC_6079 [Pristionchus entomophagus]
MRRFIVCAATIWVAQCASQSGEDRRMFVARAIRRSPTHEDFGAGLPMARGLRPKTKKPTPATTPPPITTAAPPVPQQQSVPRPAPTARPNYPPQGYQQQQQGYPPQGYQYPPNYPYYAQSRPQQQQPPPPQQQQYFNPFMPFSPYQQGQPMMVPVPVPVPMPSLLGMTNLMQPFEATSRKSYYKKSHGRRHHYATLMPQEQQEEKRSPTQEEIDVIDRNEVRRAPARRHQQQFFDDDYSEEEASTAATLFPTLPTMVPPMKLPTLPPFTLPPSFEKLLGITTPKPQKEKRRKEKRRREYEDEEEYQPVKRRRLEEDNFESRPHGRSLAVEEERGRKDPFDLMEAFEDKKEEKSSQESAPSVADRLMRKSFSSKKNEGEGEEDWLVPFRK